ncbi:nitrate reductase subunit alpha [Paramicrobacterium fandaimingii]|uniref:nitrate reductase subunit alpha n=1 Tax=Paramicrobacterium fandaimingii TaxID=2708079 RepID=UPI00141E95D4|nr:nitrate reductase subunit alpha [Microbacterium fandaimingii]
MAKRTRTAPHRVDSGARTDGPLADSLVNLGRYLRPGEVSDDLRSVYLKGGRAGDSFYRDRWSHDKVVRSTHGVNCTGSCSWKVYVKDGIITWETQQTDYPSVGPDMPEYEPRGCPRGAAFSWYTYSPTRVRYPYVRGVLLQMYREAKQRLGDPVAAWDEITSDPEKAKTYKRARGKGGLVRAEWDEAAEIIAAAHVHTIKKYGPDRVAGFSPIPAMSMVSHGVGARFVNLIGGTMQSFYDWYADLPVASPQVFGDQTDVPESADWFNAAYLMMWGSNVPVTRTPDAHFMTEARYRGQKVITVSPDYADNSKFADEWLAPHPGTDGALAMAMGHVILKEFFVDRETPRFNDYLKRFADAPYLVALQKRGDAWVPGKFITAADLGGADAETANPAFKTVLLDQSGSPVVPNGSLGHRFSEADTGKWNLDLGDVDPLLSIMHSPAWSGEAAAIDLPRFDLTPTDGAADGTGNTFGTDNGDSASDAHTGGSGVVRRGVPTASIAGQTVTTVFDLLLAQYGVGRDGLPGQWPTGYDDPSTPGTPAWQEEITSVNAEQVARIGREFADNAERSNGRSMIIMGAGTNHWFHSDTIYRTFLTLTTITGCQGVNGGGWAHYVGQEKVRPLTGYNQYQLAADWVRPARNMIGTAFWYLATDQWRYDGLPADQLASPLAKGQFADRTTADCMVESAKRGWMPSYPTFDKNPLDIVDEARATGVEPQQYVIDSLKDGSLHFACEDPDSPENFPRVLSIWRGNILGSSGKGNEYFLKHLLGTDAAVRAPEAEGDRRPRTMTWHDEAPEGKLDLLFTADFRMTSTTLFSDVVLPAATWYEKHDLSSTDMHPFVHSFNPAIQPPWQTRTDFDIFHTLAKKMSDMAVTHLGVREDLVAAPLLHDTADAMATPNGTVTDDAPLVPGVSMPKLIVVERDYTKLAEQMSALGPLTAKLGMQTKGITYDPTPEIEKLGRVNGLVQDGPFAGSVRLDTDVRACEMVLAFSGTTNGRLALQGFEKLGAHTGQSSLEELAAGSEETRITFPDVQARPVAVVTSPEWSGSEHGGRRYTAFAVNVEHKKPWHTLTGRMHFYLDHDWMLELGEALPIYRPPLDLYRLYGDSQVGSTAPTGAPGSHGRAEVAVRYLTPHSKWSIHSEYQDNLFMLSLSRGGPTIWMSPQDADKIGVRDNEWIESYNRNGVVVARAIVSHRMPEGTVFMYHAKDRTVDVPKTETSGLRGGIHNSLTRVLLKPSHLIGGYAQLSFAFNYLGPTGNQRDEVTVIRRRSQEVEY